MRDDHLTEDHIRAAARPGAETARLLAELGAECWPDGPDDSTTPVRRGWLRHFAAIRPYSYRIAMTCHCAEGRCPICN